MVNMKAFHEEIRLLVRIYNEAWAQNWGFLPLTNEEADVLAESLRPVLDPPLCCALPPWMGNRRPYSALFPTSMFRCDPAGVGRTIQI